MDDSKPLDAYKDAAPAVRQVRLMERFFRDVVDADPKTRTFFEELHVGYMEMLNKELAPYALLLALAVMQLEDAYSEIERPPTPGRVTVG